MIFFAFATVTTFSFYCFQSFLSDPRHSSIEASRMKTEHVKTVKPFDFPNNSVLSAKPQRLVWYFQPSTSAFDHMRGTYQTKLNFIYIYHITNIPSLQGLIYARISYAKHEAPERKFYYDLWRMRSFCLQASSLKFLHHLYNSAAVGEQ